MKTLYVQAHGEAEFDQPISTFRLPLTPEVMRLLREAPGAMEGLKPLGDIHELVFSVNFDGIEDSLYTDDDTPGMVFVDYHAALVGDAEGEGLYIDGSEVAFSDQGITLRGYYEDERFVTAPVSLGNLFEALEDA